MFLRSLLVLLALAVVTPAVETLVVRGSGNSTAPLIAAVPRLKALGINLQIDSEQNTSSAIMNLGLGEADLAVATRAVTSGERAAYPAMRLEESLFAYQVLALVVSADVWKGGVRALTREQMRQIYEGEVTNWSAVGGPNLAIKFFNPEVGHGVWETFVTWIYGDVRKAPTGETFERVASAEETRNVVEFNSGSLSVVAPTRIDNKGTFALGIKLDDGKIAPATAAAAKDQSYPLARRLTLVSATKPAGSIRVVIEFLRGEEGRAILEKTDYLPAE